MTAANPFPLGTVVWLFLVVLWLTWTPTGAEVTHIHLAPPAFRWKMVLGNLVLMAPIGVVLAAVLGPLPGRPVGRLVVPSLGVVGTVALMAACLSVTVEIGQLRIPGRSTSPYDVGMNVAGAAAAAWCTVRLQERGVGRRALAGAAASLVFLGVLLFLSGTALAGSRMLQLSHWSPSYGVVAGDEVGGGRPYPGGVRAPGLCAGSGADEFCVAPPSGGTLDGVIPASDRERLQRTAMGSQEVRLFATVTWGGPQEDLARIVTFSKGIHYRNATLGQEGSQLILRLRTPMGGPNGTEAEFAFPGPIREGVETRIAATVRPGRVRMELGDGRDGRVREVRWGVLSSWRLFAGERSNKLEPFLLFKAALVGGAALWLPLGAGAARLGFSSGPIPFLLGAGLPPTLMLLLATLLRLPVWGWDLVISSGFGILGVVLARLGARAQPP